MTQEVFRPIELTSPLTPSRLGSGHMTQETAQTAPTKTPEQSGTTPNRVKIKAFEAKNAPAERANGEKKPAAKTPASPPAVSVKEVSAAAARQFAPVAALELREQRLTKDKPLAKLSPEQVVDLYYQWKTLELYLKSAKAVGSKDQDLVQAAKTAALEYITSRIVELEQMLPKHPETQVVQAAVVEPTGIQDQELKNYVYRYAERVKQNPSLDQWDGEDLQQAHDVWQLVAYEQVQRAPSVEREQLMRQATQQLLAIHKAVADQRQSAPSFEELLKADLPPKADATVRVDQEVEELEEARSEPSVVFGRSKEEQDKWEKLVERVTRKTLEDLTKLSGQPDRVTSPRMGRAPGGRAATVSAVDQATLPTLGTFTDAEVQRRAGEIEAIRQAGRLDHNYIIKQRDRIQQLVDNSVLNAAPGTAPIINVVEAEQLANSLDQWRRAFEAVEVRGMRRGEQYKDREDEARDANVELENKTITVAERFTKLKEIIDRFNVDAFNQEMPEAFLREIAKDRRALDYLINRAYQTGLSREDSHFEGARYEMTNIRNMQRKLAKLGGGEIEDPNKPLPPGAPGRFKELHEYYIQLDEATEKSHNMNLVIRTGGLKEFLKFTEGFGPKQFNAIRDTVGVNPVMRLYEYYYKEILAKHGYIRAKQYQEIAHKVDKAFRLQVQQGVLGVEYNDAESGKLLNYGKLEEWEILRALALGRNMMSLSFRIAEYVSLGYLPDRVADLFASFDAESVVRQLNWLEWLGLRFELAEARGGVWMMKKAREIFAEHQREKRKKEPLLINHLLGRSIEHIEAAGMMGISGIYSGWRNELAFLDQITVMMDDAPEVEYIDKATEKIVTMKKGPKVIGETITNEGRYKSGPHKGKEKGLDKEARTAFINKIISEHLLTIGFGSLLLSGQLTEKAKVTVWNKVAELDPLVMANYLRGLQVTGSLKGQVKHLEQIFKDVGGVSDDEWDTFVEDLQLIHQKRMAKELDRLGKIKRGEPTSKTGDKADFITSKITNPKFLALYYAIRDNGRKIAPELAKIDFPNAPFMDDVPFEMADYSHLGQEFFRRRETSDLTGVAEGNGAIGQYLGDPGNNENAHKSFSTIISSLAGVHGYASAQDRMLPWVQARLEFKKMFTFFREIPFMNVLLGSRYLPTSVEEKYYGEDGDSWDEDVIHEEIKKHIHVGHIRGYIQEGKHHSQAHQLEKAVHVTLLHTLRAKGRKVVPGYLLALLIEFVKSLFQSGGGGRK